MMPDYYTEDPYKVNNVFEATKWVFKGTNTSIGLAKTVVPALGLITNPVIIAATKTPAPVKLEVLDTTTTAIISTLACIEEHIATLFDTKNTA